MANWGTCKERGETVWTMSFRNESLLDGNLATAGSTSGYSSDSSVKSGFCGSGLMQGLGGVVGDPATSQSPPEPHRSRMCAICKVDTHSYNLNYGANSCLR